MGSGTSTHKGYGSITVIDYAGSFTGNGKCILSEVAPQGTTSDDASSTEAQESEDGLDSEGKKGSSATGAIIILVLMLLAVSAVLAYVLKMHFELKKKFEAL